MGMVSLLDMGMRSGNGGLASFYNYILFRNSICHLSRLQCNHSASLCHVFFNAEMARVIEVDNCGSSKVVFPKLIILPLVKYASPAIILYTVTGCMS